MGGSSLGFFFFLLLGGVVTAGRSSSQSSSQCLGLEGMSMSRVKYGGLVGGGSGTQVRHTGGCKEAPVRGGMDVAR